LRELSKFDRNKLHKKQVLEVTLLTPDTFESPTLGWIGLSFVA
jgi:hypothetical protein